MTEAEEGELSLDQLAPGTTAAILEISAPAPLAQRLADLGLVPGTRIDCVRRAPLGDPTEYCLRGYNLCLRRSEAQHVRLEPLHE